MVLLTIVTLGIYQLFWLYWTKNELNKYGAWVPGIIWLFVGPVLMLASIVTYLVLEQTNNSGGLHDYQGSWGVIFLLSASIVNIAIYLAWFWYYCKAVSKVTNRSLPALPNYLLFVALTIIGIQLVWPLIVQSTYNRTVFRT